MLLRIKYLIQIIKYATLGMLRQSSPGASSIYLCERGKKVLPFQI